MSETTPPPEPPGLERAVWWLDEAIPIPGTSLRLGVDPILGLVLPGLGDAVTGVAGLSLVVAAHRRGVPVAILVRMVGNLAIDALAGTVPLVGDLFDLTFRANRRNLDLLQAHRQETPAPLSGPERLALVAVAIAALVAVAIPIAVAATLGWAVASALR